MGRSDIRPERSKRQRTGVPQINSDVTDPRGIAPTDSTEPLRTVQTLSTSFKQYGHGNTSTGSLRRSSRWDLHSCTVSAPSECRVQACFELFR
jgi:hypothetical protein